MLHVVFLILKIIGIILALLIGLIVLLLCIVLFAPIKYQVRAEFANTIESIYISGKVSWIFHLIRGFFNYKDSEVTWQFKIAWRKLNIPEDTNLPLEDEKNIPSPFTDKEEGTSYNTGENVVATTTPVTGEARSTDIPVRESFTQLQPKPLIVKEETKKEKESIFEKIRKLYDKIMNAIKNIKYTIIKLCDSIKIILTKKDKIVEFISDDIHKVAFLKLKKEMFKFIKKLKPKKLILKGTFGFEDPSITGQVLAGLSILYPFVGGHIHLMPDFENQIFEGEAFVKGKIRLVYILITVIRLLANKSVRKTIKDIRQFNS